MIRRPGNSGKRAGPVGSVYGDFYLKRAVVTMAGLGANQPEDAIYPLAVSDRDGRPNDGEHDYVLHFSADQLPPVDAFWSITMYDVDGFQTANQINRFAIGDRDGLTFNPDGSLDIYVQHDDPGPERESNGLPAPAAPSASPCGCTPPVRKPWTGAGIRRPSCGFVTRPRADRAAAAEPAYR